MPTFVVGLVSKVAGLGTAAKVAMATIAAAATITAAGGAVAVLAPPRAASDTAAVAHAGLEAGTFAARADPAAPIVAPAGVAVAVASPPPAAAKAAAAATTKPAAAARTSPSSTPPTTVAAVPTSPRAPAPVAAPSTPGVPRRTPTDAEVQQALKTFPQYVKTFIKPTAAQVAELGDRVCTAFDEGQTYAQVKATGLEMVTQVPRTTVLPGGADWVIRTIVTMYCPGYATKLG